MIQLTRAQDAKLEVTKKISAISVPISFICILLLTPVNHVRTLTVKEAVLIRLTCLLIVWNSKHLTIRIHQTSSLLLTCYILVTAQGVWVTVKITAALLLTLIYLAAQAASWNLLPVLHGSLVVHWSRTLAVFKVIVDHRCIVVMVRISIDWVNPHSCLINV